MDVIMPQLGETVREGTVSRWNKQVGEIVAADEPLFEVETDKVTTEVPAPASGVLAKILIEEGIPVKVGALLAVIEDVSRAAPGLSDAPSSATIRTAASGAKSNGAGASEERTQAFPARGEPGQRLSPVVRRLLAEHQLTADRIRGTGRH